MISLVILPMLVTHQAVLHILMGSCSPHYLDLEPPKEVIQCLFDATAALYIYDCVCVYACVCGRVCVCGCVCACMCLCVCLSHFNGFMIHNYTGGYCKLENYFRSLYCALLCRLSAAFSTLKHVILLPLAH